MRLATGDESTHDDVTTLPTPTLPSRPHTLPPPPQTTPAAAFAPPPPPPPLDTSTDRQRSPQSASKRKLKVGEGLCKEREGRYLLIDIDILEKFMNDIASTCKTCKTKVQVKVGEEKGMVKSVKSVCKKCKLGYEIHTSKSDPGGSDHHHHTSPAAPQRSLGQSTTTTTSPAPVDLFQK